MSCEVVRPRPQRPTEGELFFNVELSPMASPAFEVGRPSPVATRIARMLERCLKESRAVDMESLCIIAGEKVRERGEREGGRVISFVCFFVRCGLCVWMYTFLTTVETSLTLPLLQPLLPSNTSGLYVLRG